MQPDPELEIDLKATIAPNPDGSVTLILHQIQPEQLPAIFTKLGTPEVQAQFLAGIKAELEQQNRPND